MDTSYCEETEPFKGDLCDRNCRYLQEELDKVLENAKERANLIEGYDIK